ncbi:MAG: aldo/keto reductase [Anaerolineaceae bacterium]|nr:aldo/keto reductase [Anaerolineaceae bacterium]
MEYRSLGSSGIKVSVIGIGANRFGSEKMPQKEVNRVIDAALDLGINFIDSADVYAAGRSEETIGAALKGRWDKFIVATKFGFPASGGDSQLPNQKGASRLHIMNAVEASLCRLQRDHIDLYYVHTWDKDTPIEETLRALDNLVQMGKVRYIGASNFASWQLARANLLAEVHNWTAFICIQNHYNMFERADEREMLPYCAAHNVGYIPYFPLASGFLTGKYKRGKPFPKGSRAEDWKKAGREVPYDSDSHYDRIEAMESWAKARGHGLNELAQAWLLAKPQIPSVISGATKMEHILSNVKAAEWKLTEDEVKEVDAILRE